MISVLMPCYNNTQYMRDSVRSILDQTYGGFELIIIDDGSTVEDTPEMIVDEFADSDRGEGGFGSSGRH